MFFYEMDSFQSVAGFQSLQLYFNILNIIIRDCVCNNNNGLWDMESAIRNSLSDSNTVFISFSWWCRYNS